MKFLDWCCLIKGRANDSHCKKHPGILSKGHKKVIIPLLMAGLSKTGRQVFGREPEAYCVIIGSARVDHLWAWLDDSAAWGNKVQLITLLHCLAILHHAWQMRHALPVQSPLEGLQGCRPRGNSTILHPQAPLRVGARPVGFLTLCGWAAAHGGGHIQGSSGRLEASRGDVPLSRQAVGSQILGQHPGLASCLRVGKGQIGSRCRQLGKG